MRYFKYLVFVLILCLYSQVYAAETNLMEKASIDGPFTGLEFLYDGKLVTPSISEPVGSKSQRLVIDLKKREYVKEVVIYWEKGAYPRKFDLWMSESNVTQVPIKDLRPDNAHKKGALVEQVVPMNSQIFRYLTLFIPPNSKIGRDNRARIKEIKVIREDNPVLKLTDIKQIVSDTEINIVFNTNINAESQIHWGEDNWMGKLKRPLVKKIPKTQHSGILYGLKPNTKYRYKVMVNSPGMLPIKSKWFYFKTRKRSLAYKQPVVGTFTNIHDDPNVSKVVPALERLTDGSNSYFSSMADSGSVKRGAQFIVVDLWKQYKVSNVLLYWRALAYPKTYSVLVSRDNKNWRKIADNQDASDGFYTQTGPPMFVKQHTFNPKTARYIKVVVPKNSRYFVRKDNWDFVSLFEIKVF